MGVRRTGQLAGRLAVVFLLAVWAPAAAQEPPRNAAAYVLLGLIRLDVSNSITITTGSIGVNRSGGDLIGNGRVELAAGDGVVAADGVTLQQPSTCAALFANRAGGSGLCASAQPVSLPLVPGLDQDETCRLPDPFPNCDSANPVTVGSGETRALAPGTYGNLTVVAGTLELAGGTYVFCNVTLDDGGALTVGQPSTLLVTDRVNVNPNSFVNPSGSPGDLRVLVSGLGVNVSGSDTGLVLSPEPVAAPGAVRAAQTCFFGRTGRRASVRTRVIAEVCAPRQNAQMNLFGAELIGTFVGYVINTGGIVGSIAPPPTTSTTTTTTSTSTAPSSTTTSSTTTTTTTTTSTSSSTTTSTTTVSSTSEPPTTVTSSTSTSSTSSSTTVPATSTTVTAPSTSTTSTSTSTSTSTTSPPVCDNLRVTSIRYRKRTRSSKTGRLVVRGVLADSGWSKVDPRRDDVSIGLLMPPSDASCCTIGSSHWMKLFPTQFGFWDKQRGICPPIADADLAVKRIGSAGFKVVAPKVDLTEDMLTHLTIGVRIGEYCSVGSLDVETMRQRGRTLVWP